jgi:putative phage-type endonuclease
MSRKVPNINARDFATILNINPYQTPFELLEQKIEGKHPFFGNKFTDHGNKYEKYAIKVYEQQTGNIVNTEMKNMKHDNYEWITGRMDGIIEENNTKKRKRSQTPNIKRKKIKISKYVIEVKCPLKDDRKEPLTIDNIPKYYWTQCQVYMNMIDCEFADYIEYYIKPNEPEDSGILYTLNLKRDRQWWEEVLPKIKAYYEEVKIYFEKGSLDDHPVRIAEKEWEKIFTPLTLTPEK